MSRVKVVPGIENIQIFIGDILHLSVNTEKLTGITSYKKGVTSYNIEFHAGQTIVCEYETRALWEEILKLLVEAKVC